MICCSQPSIVPSKSGYGYVNWSHDSHEYKRALAREIDKAQLHIISKLLKIDTELVTFVLAKKLYNLLECPDILLKYTHKELKKLSRLIECSSAYSLCRVLTKVPLDKLTTKNVKDLYKYIRDFNDFYSGTLCVGWGPGNNKYPEVNALQHMRKHYTDPLQHNNTYVQCPIDVFYYMRDVIVHSNGRGTYLSGFYNNTFVVGRYEGDVFGISSCYYVESGIKDGRLKDYCFCMWN